MKLSRATTGRGKVRIAAAAALLLSGSMLSACGEGGAAQESGGVTTLNVAMFPLTDVAPIYLGIEQGFFKEEDLKVVPKQLDGGPAVTASVVAGDSQIGFSNPLTLVVGKSKGLPLTAVAPATAGASSPDKAWAAVVVKKDSPIRSASDLVGKKVAVNALKNILDLTLRASLDKHGVDPDSVKQVEIPFPETAAALSSGRVDAAFTAEPYLTQIKQEDARVIMTPYEDVALNLPSSLYFTTESFLKGDSDAVKRFQRALTKSVTYANEHPDETRDIVSTYTEIDPETLKVMEMPVFMNEVDAAKVGLYAELGQKFGLVPAEAPAEKVVSDLLDGLSAP